MKREHNDCLTQCVAKYFGLNPNRVPLFVKYGRNYGKHLRAFFKRRGFKIEWVNYQRKILSNKRNIYIVTGLSWRKGNRHAVLYKGKERYYDSHSSQNFLREPEHIWIVTKIRKKKK